MPDKMVNAEEIRERYHKERAKLNECFTKDMLYEGKICNEKDYRIARRKIVLLRQKELLDGGFLTNDEMLDENDKPTGTYELDWINLELATGVQDRMLVCPDDTYPHNPYPVKVQKDG